MKKKPIYYTVGQKIYESPVKSNKSISRFFFEQIPFLAISKMAKNQFLNWDGKKFKTVRNANSQKFF